LKAFINNNRIGLFVFAAKMELFSLSGKQIQLSLHETSGIADKKVNEFFSFCRTFHYFCPLT